jgi:hypothetical protein
MVNAEVGLAQSNRNSRCSFLLSLTDVLSKCSINAFGGLKILAKELNAAYFRIAAFLGFVCAYFPNKA